MYKLIVKYEKDTESENSIVSYPVDVFECDNFSWINDSILAIQIKNESIMIPIRRIREVKVRMK